MSIFATKSVGNNEFLSNKVYPSLSSPSSPLSIHLFFTLSPFPLSTYIWAKDTYIWSKNTYIWSKYTYILPTNNYILPTNMYENNWSKDTHIWSKDMYICHLVKYIHIWYNTIFFTPVFKECRRLFQYLPLEHKNSCLHFVSCGTDIPFRSTL